VRALLDVNVLLALLDASHADHTRARNWLGANIDHGWASCAITQNGVVRIMSQHAYPGRTNPATAVEMLRAAAATEHHEFWPGTVSIVNPESITANRIHSPRQITDAYLLSLAVAYDGRFVTLDGRIAITAVPGATHEHLTVI